MLTETSRLPVNQTRVPTIIDWNGNKRDGDATDVLLITAHYNAKHE